MGTKNNLFAIDMASLTYGRSPVPLAPKALRALWEQQGIPSWVSQELGLPDSAFFSMLGPDVWNHASAAGERVAHYMTFLLRTRSNSLRHVRCFDQVWPVGLDIASVPFSVRSRNSLIANGYMRDPERLLAATFGELLEVPNLGVKSALEITTLLEAAMDLHQRLTTIVSSDFANRDRSEENLKLWRQKLTAALNEPWIDQISLEDRRFAGVLPPGKGSLEERIERLLLDPNSIASVVDLPVLLTGIDKVRQIVKRLESQHLEDSLRQILVSYVGREEVINAIAQRLGWDGNDPKTLQEVGDRMGVTRERIRQLEETFLTKLPRQSIYVPQLDEGLKLLEQHSPVTIDKAASLLKHSKVTKEEFSAKALINVARLLGRETSLRLELIKDKEFVVVTNKSEGLGHVTRIAYRLAGANGVSSIFQVAEVIAELLLTKSSKRAQGRETDQEDIRLILTSISEYEFLNEDWFWIPKLPEGRNRLTNIARKVLSVVAPQSVLSVREAVRRVYSWRTATKSLSRGLMVPPLAVMKAFFNRHPDFVINDDQVEAIDFPDYRKVLGEAEQTIVEIFRSSPAGLLDRRTLIEDCVKRGLNNNTLSVYTTYSPILEHVGLDMWKLRGANIDPAAVEALRQQNLLEPRERRLLDHGWTAQGKLWVAWRLPKLINAPVFGIPGAVRRYLEGRNFAGSSENATLWPGGSIGITQDGSSYGYGPFLRYSGGDEGDVLIAKFDLAQNSVQLSLATEAPSPEESVQA